MTPEVFIKETLERIYQQLDHLEILKCQLEANLELLLEAQGTYTVPLGLDHPLQEVLVGLQSEQELR